MKQAYYHRHRVMMNSGHKCDKIFIFCLYLCCRRRSNYQEGEGWDPIIRFNTATFFFTCSRPGSGFPMQYVMFFFHVFNCLNEKVIVDYFDIGEIVEIDHHCLNFIFISHFMKTFFLQC